MKKILIMSLLVAVSASFVACSDDEDEPVEGEPATSKFYAYGEPFIEDGIPASAFADGWAITFSEFVITVNDAGIKGAGPWSETSATALYVDVAKAGNEAANPGTAVGTVATTTNKTYDEAFYTIAPATVGNNVNAADATVTEMQAAGASVLVRGTATKGDSSINFDWALNSSSTYNPCEIQGFSPVASEETRVELTIHGDHLFYDSLSSEDPDLIFQAYADADANADGTVTIGELEAVQVIDTNFNAGGADDVKTLLDFVTFQSTTLGHINGEGHCERFEQ